MLSPNNAFRCDAFRSRLIRLRVVKYTQACQSHARASLLIYNAPRECLRRCVQRESISLRAFNNFVIESESPQILLYNSKEEGIR